MARDKDWLSPTFRALMIEATMAAAQCAIGITAFGKANYAQTAYYYQAFFALGVGLERATKLAFVIDHMLENNGSFPSEKQIRGYKHDLRLLLESTDRIAEKRGLTDKGIRLPSSPVQQGMVGVLSDFANNITRYYNLDLILSNLSEKEYDPVLAWHERVTLPVLRIHYKLRRRQLDERRAKLTDQLIGSFTFVRHHSESGNPIDSVGKASAHIAMTDYAIPYSRMYLMQILRFVGKTLSELGYIANRKRLEDVPYLDEIFGIYNNSDTLFRKRKTWSIF